MIKECNAQQLARQRQKSNARVDAADELVDLAVRCLSMSLQLHHEPLGPGVGFSLDYATRNAQETAELDSLAVRLSFQGCDHGSQLSK